MNQKVLCLQVTYVLWRECAKQVGWRIFSSIKKQQESWVSMGNFPKKSPSAWHVFVWWILESLLRPERIKKDRGKMEDKVWGEDCFAPIRLDDFLALFFSEMSFFPVWTQLERKGPARFWGCFVGLLFGFQKSLCWFYWSSHRHALRSQSVVTLLHAVENAPSKTCRQSKQPPCNFFHGLLLEWQIFTCNLLGHLWIKTNLISKGH